MPSSLQTYTYRNGKKLLLTKAEDEFVVRLLPDHVEKLDFKNLRQVSSASTRVQTTPEQLEADMQKCREAAPTHHAYYAADTGEPFLITDRILVVFKTGASAEDIDRFAGQYGLRLVSRFSEREYLYQVTSHTGINPVKLVVELTENNDLVELVENDLNYVAKKYAFQLPTDPLYVRQWHLHTHSQHPEFHPRSSSRCEEAWLLLQHFGKADVVIGISDDGCKVTHPDFSAPGKIPAWGYFEGQRLVTQGDADADPTRMYQTGADHGTACAGVAAGSANAALAVGAAPGCALLPIKWESDQFGLYIGDSKLHTALDFIADKVDVFSNSWGITPVSQLWTSTVNKIADLAKTGGRRGKGIVFLWAAGNENCPIEHTSNQNIPYSDGWRFQNNQWVWTGVQTARVFRNSLANIEGVMHIAALSSLGQRSHYSNYGTGIDIAAPSSNSHAYFRLTVKGLGIATSSGTGGGTIQDFGGTSSATPLVAGIAALVLSANSQLSALEVISILKQTASKDLDPQGYPRTPPANFDPNPTWDISPVAPFNSGAFQNNGSPDGSWSPWFGHGKVDALEAVRKALELAAQHQATSVRIVGALVNPAGTDFGKEKITLLNTSNADISLDGWSLTVNNRKQQLQGLINGGEARTIPADPTKLVLVNTGATIRLLTPDGTVAAEATYTKAQVKVGQVLVF